MDEPRRFAKSFLEVLAVVAPVICLVDCVVIPVILALLPFFGATGWLKIWHGVGDQFLALLVLLICTPVIVPGYIQHRKKSVLVFMAAGFTLIFLANFIGHPLDESVHTVLTLMGSCFLVKANWDNKRFRKACHSHCGCSSSGPIIRLEKTKAK